MSSQKLFVFVAQDVPVAALIRKGKMGGRPCYQIIRWDMTTNEFTEGQWLLNKQLFVRGCSISPNGQLFGWYYNQFWKKSADDTHAGVSTLPNFTAELYGAGGCGRWDAVVFDSQSRPLAMGLKFEKSAPSGLKPENFQTADGRNVQVDGYKLIVDGVVLYDAENNVFVSREKIV